MRCGICGEHYDNGPREHHCANYTDPDHDVDACTVGFTSWPDGDSYYWRHTRESEKHQAICRQSGIVMGQLLTRMPDAINLARLHQKRMRNPALQGLRRLFR